MPQLDLLKELESLRKRIETLESKASDKNSLQMFGRSYSQAGSSNSDFVIKTKGQVKIQWGNKFIDLIKDGKINADMKFIFQRDSVGVKDGIYIIGDGDNQQVILSVNGNQINLKGEIGTTYVSFQSEQETTSEQKYTALQNIGFIYRNLSEVTSNSLQNGIIYVEQEQKLYIVQNGALSEFTIEFPNPYTRQFVIQKSDSSTGALLIVGNGIENSLAFDTFYLYSANNGVYLDSNGEIYFRISEQEKVKITQDTAIFNIDVTSRMFKSPSATESSGFRLYFQDGESTLEVDNLKVRNQKEDSQVSMIYPIYWNYKNNIILSVEEMDNPDDPTETGFGLILAFENEFEVGQLLYTYVPILDETTGSYQKILLPLQVEMLNTEGNKNTVYTSIREDLIEQEILQSLDTSIVFEQLKGQTVFLVQINGETLTLLRKKDRNIDLVEVQQPEDASNDNTVISRLGDLSPLQKNERNSGTEILIEGFGVYSNNAAFLKARYTSDYNLPISDNSSKFVSTEWIHKLFPKGTILMFGGSASDIPEGWSICDGSNGTPNLIDKFIKSSTTAGDTGGDNEVTLTIDNLPPHTHTVESGTVNTSTDGDHSHTYTSPVMGVSGNANNRNVVESTGSGTTSSAGSHSHTIDLSSVVLSTVGLGEPIKIEPPYYTLLYIMKVV